jgi:hypothetical protein
MHEPAGEIPFENDAVDRVRGQAKNLLALRELMLHVATFSDVTRIDDDALDEGIAKCRDIVRFQPTKGAVLVTDPVLMGKARHGAVHELSEPAAQFSDIIGMNVLENGMGASFFGGIAE